MYEGGRLSPFVGESRIKMVDGLLALYDRVVQEGQPIWVSLEAPSGWGKTRVGREFYSRLAARQEAPAYWPPRIDNPDLGRKAVHPPRFDSPEKSLPEFFWWGIACSTRSGRPTDALSQDLRQIHAHGDYLEAQWWALVSFHERHFPTLAETGKALRSIGFAGALSRGVEEVAEAVTPGLRIVTRVGRWIGTEAKKSREVRERANRASHYDDSEPLDIVDDTVDLLTRISKPGLPIVLLVEDVHDADGMLIEFLGKLLEHSIPIFVITTAWPDQINRNAALVDLLESHSPHLHRIYHTAPAGPPFPSDAGLGILEPDARATILHHYYPRVETHTQDELLERYTNPLALELFCQIKRYHKRFPDGDLHLKAEEVNLLPQKVRELYQELWRQLPEPMRFALAVAHVITPANINSDEALGEDRWTDPLLRDVIHGLDWPNREDIISALDQAPNAYAWVRIIDKALRAFAESMQKEIAKDDGQACLEDEFDETREHILNVLAASLLRTPSEQTTAAHRARTILALHAKNFIASDHVAAEAIETLLVEMADSPRELTERVRLFKRFTHLDLDPQEQSFHSKTRIVLLGARALSDIGELKEAIAAYEALLDDLQQVLGPDHPDTLTTRSNLAGCLGGAGRLAEATAADKALLDDQERVLGPDHPQTLTTRSNLAHWLGRAGRVAEATAAYEELLTDHLRILGPDHLDTLNTRNNLAQSLGEAGRVAEATTAYEALLDDLQRVLGPDHPHTLTTRNNLAQSLGEAGRVADAAAAYETLLDDQQRILGADHPDTLTTRNNLAHWLGEAGRAADAATAYQELLDDQQRILGADHPHTLTTRANLAHWLGRTGRVAEATTAYQASLDDHQRILGADHPHTLTTRNNLAHWLGEAGRAADATTAYAASLDDHERVLGADHPHTLTTRNSLAHWLGRTGRVAEATTAYQALLGDRQRILGPDHPHTLTTRSELAHWLGEAGRVAEATTTYAALLGDLQRILGPDHPDTLTTRNNLAHYLGEAGRVAEATTAYQALLGDQQRILGPDHPDTLTTRNNLAHWLGEAGRVAEATTTNEALLDDLQRVLGPDHPDTLTTRNNLAHHLGEAGRVAEATAAYEALLADRERVLGPDHPDTLATRNGLAACRAGRDRDG